MSGLTDTAGQIASQYGIPSNIFNSLITTESSWNPSATSSAGAMGLTQLMPSTAARLGVTSPYDVLQNLNGGAKYLASLFKRYGNWQSALSAYNSGNPSSAAGLAYANTVLNGAGISTASAPGPQSSPPSTNSTVGGSKPSTTQGPISGTVTYTVAIIVILLLVAFGVWGVMKG
jgi:membrane-bound lytic murein transglycosylase B